MASQSERDEFWESLEESLADSPEDMAFEQIFIEATDMSGDTWRGLSESDMEWAWDLFEAAFMIGGEGTRLFQDEFLALLGLAPADFYDLWEDFYGSA